MKSDDLNSTPQPTAKPFDGTILYLPPLGYGMPERLAILHRGKTLGPFTYPEADGLTDLLLAFRRHHPPGLSTILLIVADHYNVDVAQMAAPCRVPAVAWARHVAMSLCSQFFHQDSKHLARIFGCHHSLVRAARKKILAHQKTAEGRAELALLRGRICRALEEPVAAPIRTNSQS